MLIHAQKYSLHSYFENIFDSCIVYLDSLHHWFTCDSLWVGPWKPPDVLFSSIINGTWCHIVCMTFYLPMVFFYHCSIWVFLYSTLFELLGSPTHTKLDYWWLCFSKSDKLHNFCIIIINVPTLPTSPALYTLC